MVNSEPPGANVSVSDGRAGVTPFSFRTARDEDLQFHVSKAGYQPSDISDPSKFQWGYGISDLFFTGLIGLGIDAMDGAAEFLLSPPASAFRSFPWRLATREVPELARV